MQLKKNKRNEQSKKNPKLTTNGNNVEETNINIGQNSLSCNSEDEYSNASENLNEGTISDPKLKPRTNKIKGLQQIPKAFIPGYNN